jgi:hypothetical protein
MRDLAYPLAIWPPHPDLRQAYPRRLTLHLVGVHLYSRISLYPAWRVFYAGDMVQSDVDVPLGISKLTVPEAADALEISPEAVRNRLSRGTLKSVKEHGRVFVLIDRDMVRDTDDIPTDKPPESTAVIEAKDETIRILEEQLESERAASAELRRIVAGLVQRVPELEPAQDSRESAISTSDSPGEGEVPPEREKTVSWWRRLWVGGYVE